MRRTVLILMAALLLCLEPALELVEAAGKDSCRVILYAPAEIRLDTTKSIPITVCASTADGKPFSGEVDLSAEEGKFVSTAGPSPSPFSVKVTEGKGEVVLSLEGLASVVTPLRVSATRDGTLLGEIGVKIRSQYHIGLSISRPSLPADGRARPELVAFVEDQLGEPMDDVEVTVKFSGPPAKDLQIRVRTDANGEIRMLLPPSIKAGYGVVEAGTEQVASLGLDLLYAEAKPAMISLREAAAGAGAPFYWEAKTRTAVIVLGQSLLTVREGEAVARIERSQIPLGTAARVRNGHLEVPRIFVEYVFSSVRKPGQTPPGPDTLRAVPRGA